ncbi:MAG: hypothetical protein ACK6DC_13755 [Planctomycetota bacterium]|jgi:hypothetical protein
MFYQIDERLSLLSANLWRFVEVTSDSNIERSRITTEGYILGSPWPELHPESIFEKHTSLNWVIRRTGRVKQTDAVPLFHVVDGVIVGDVGFHYWGETDSERQLRREINQEGRFFMSSKVENH